MDQFDLSIYDQTGQKMFYSSSDIPFLIFLFNLFKYFALQNASSLALAFNS